MAYFDNAATTYPKPEVVYTSMDKFYRSNGANAGRGRYNLAQSANTLIGETRALAPKTSALPSKASCFYAYCNDSTKHYHPGPDLQRC